MRDFIDRQVFLLKSRVNVLYSNFLVNQAFNPEAQTQQKKVAYSATAFTLLMLIGIGFGSTFMSDNSKIAIPAVATTPVPTVTIALPTIPEPKAEPEVAAIPEIPAPYQQIPALPEMPPVYILAINKATETLFIMKETPLHYEIVQSFAISLGEIIGAKEKEGDLRTPEGFYKVLEIMEDEELPAIYGPRAFVLNYPNRFDSANGRTGGGIWLHGSGMGKRTPDTRGCVELDDSNIIALSQWATIGTKIAIFPPSFNLPVIDGKVDKRFLTSEFFYGDFNVQERMASVQ